MLLKKDTISSASHWYRHLMHNAVFFALGHQNHLRKRQIQKFSPNKLRLFLDKKLTVKANHVRASRANLM